MRTAGFTVLISVFAAALTPASLWGATITGLLVSNESTADSMTSANAADRSFRTGSVSLGPIQTAGDDVSFTSQFSWQNAIRVQPGGATTALTSPRTTAYLLTFTVEDALSQGYSLNVDTALRGFVTADWDSGSTVTAGSGSVSGRIDTNMDDGTDTLGTQVSNLTLSGSSTSATSSDPTRNVLVAGTKSHAAGGFVGTRTFGLRFTTLGSSANVFMQNSTTGEAAARFGMDPSPAANFPASTYPGADGESAALHGHFVTVTASVNPVPEPAAAGLFAVAACVMVRRRRAAVSCRRAE